MNCKEFSLWLRTRDIHDSLIPQDAARHMTGCPSCEQLFNLDTRLEAGIQKGFSQEEVPKGLAEQISLSLKPERTSRDAKLFMTAGAVLAGLIILVLVLLPFETASPPNFKDLNQISLQAVKDHLNGNYYMSFNADQTGQALDRLTKELGFRVLLPDLSEYNCTLLGGRLCALGDCRAAYFILEKEGRTGSLFIMDTQHLNFDMAEGSRFNTRLKGCEADVWKDNGQIYAMVF
jgi:hypothetical protein